MRYSEAHTEAAQFELIREMREVSVVARFTVEGEPVSKARPRFTRTGRSFTPQATVDAEHNMAAAFRAAATDHEVVDDLTYGVTALFFHGTRQRRDVDNCLKLVLDGLNGQAWADDAQVTEVSGRKSLVHPSEARTEVVVYRVGSVPRLTMACHCCGAHFSVYPGTKRKFCSRACRYETATKPRPRCLTCDEPVKDQRNRYCSRDCMGSARAGLSIDCYSLRHAQCDGSSHAPSGACDCICHLDPRETK